MKSLFLTQEFKVTYNKIYSTCHEENIRFNTFVDNLNIANLLNVANEGAIFGVTKFSDLTKLEFISQYFGAPNASSHPRVRDSNDSLSFSTLRRTSEIAISTQALTTTLVDWSGIYTTPVRDQGACK